MAVVVLLFVLLLSAIINCGQSNNVPLIDTLSDKASVQQEQSQFNTKPCIRDGLPCTAKGFAGCCHACSVNQNLCCIAPGSECKNGEPNTCCNGKCSGGYCPEGVQTYKPGEHSEDFKDPGGKKAGKPKAQHLALAKD